MVDTEVGFAVYTGGQVAKTTDGENWSATTVSGSSDANDIHGISEYFAWVAGADGLYYTMDGGTTWSVRTTYNAGAIDFYNELFGIAVGGAANGSIWMTLNGGYDWLALPAFTHGGLTDVRIVSPKLAYFTGLASGGTGYIGKITPA